MPLDIPASATEQIADTQLLEHPGRSGLDHENRLLWRVPRVCELPLSTVVVERYRRESRAVIIESIPPRPNSTRLPIFFRYFLLVRTQPALFFTNKLPFLFLVRTGPTVSEISTTEPRSLHASRTDSVQRTARRANTRLGSVGTTADPDFTKRPARSDRHYTSDNVCVFQPQHSTSLIISLHFQVSPQLLEVSLLGVGTVLRLEMDAWSMVK